MPRFSLAGFKDPVRRPRYIIWGGVLVLMMAAVVITALGVTSTRWFCAEACHKVQDDTIVAYQHSSHNQISCMACHMPVGSDPVTFMLHKAEALGELYLTVTNKYELPLNPESEVAEEMEATQCTQCHSDTREITPGPGIIIDHKVHADNDVKCTMCHNRVAHVEDFELTLKDPNSGKNHKHEDFMKMEACFRCHSLGPKPAALEEEHSLEAPGRCSACHPKDFELKPENHLQAGFYPKGHAEMWREKGGAAVEGGAEGEGAEGEAKPGGGDRYCLMCHDKDKFCGSCHGMEMPHPAEFVEKSHPELVKTKAKKCEFCHAASKTKFCDDCHHGQEQSKWAFKKDVAWKTQHAQAVTANGVKGCLGKCHETKFCSDCHTKEKPLPTSHKATDWLHKARTVSTAGKVGTAKPTASHAVNATKDFTTCEVCHGAGGAKSKFCTGCHKVEMPHPEQFKKFHSGTGRKNAAQCANCHQFKELCSDCHHQGATVRANWLSVHPKTVANTGAQPCFEKCHKDKKFCVNCHTSKKVLPSSHKAGDWTRRTRASAPAKHQTTFKASQDSCTYCHGEGGTSSKFCSGCHKLPMPHPIDGGDKQKFLHKPAFQSKKLAKATCANCHQQVFCDNCHHPGASTKVPWGATKAGANVQHKVAVNKSGAEPCFECHKEAYCSYCHVRLK